MKLNKLLIGLVPALAVSVTMACTKRPQSTAENKDRVGSMDSGSSATESAKTAADDVGDAAKSAAEKAGDAASDAGATATDAAKSAATAAGTAATSAADAVTPGTTNDTTGDTTTGTTDTTTGTADTTGTTGDTTAPSDTATTGTTPSDSTATQPSDATPAVVAVSIVSLNRGEVRKLQAALNSQGAHLDEDGIVGPRTTAALKKYQTDNNLEGDGTLTADTLDRLGLEEIKQAH